MSIFPSNYPILLRRISRGFLMKDTKKIHKFIKLFLVIFILIIKMNIFYRDPKLCKHHLIEKTNTSHTSLLCVSKYTQVILVQSFTNVMNHFIPLCVENRVRPQTSK